MMADAPAAALATTASGSASLIVAHAASSYRRYPGEPLTFHTRVVTTQRVSGLRLQVGLEAGLRAGDALCTTNGLVPRAAVTARAAYFLWEVPGDLEAGRQFDFTIQAVVEPTPEDRELASRALVWPLTAEYQAAPASEETVTVAVAARGRYLRHLPAVYEEDEVMGRFLMLFESFWGPITNQIDQMDAYLDPALTQKELLPWLASWIGLTLDERWPEDRRRELLRSAVTLFRRRGTRRGLQEILEIFTGQKPQIIEHGANNLRLGPEARLGPSIALGTSNRPHTFQVLLSLPPAAGGNGDAAEQARLEDQRRRMIAAIIDAEKPAHTDYTLQLEIVEPESNGVRES